MEQLLHIGFTAEVLPGPIRIPPEGCLSEKTVKDPDPSANGRSARSGAAVPFPSFSGRTSSDGHWVIPDGVWIVADLMSPLGATTCITHSLREAADRMAESRDALIVTGLNNTAIGFISTEELQAAAHSDPTGWQKKLCAAVVQFCDTRIRPHHRLEVIIELYRNRGIRPLMVFNGETPIGLLQPAAVRQWCKDHAPLPLDELMYKPRLNLADPYGIEAM